MQKVECWVKVEIKFFRTFFSNLALFGTYLFSQCCTFNVFSTMKSSSHFFTKLGRKQCTVKPRYNEVIQIIASNKVAPQQTRFLKACKQWALSSIMGKPTKVQNLEEQKAQTVLPAPPMLQRVTCDCHFFIKYGIKTVVDSFHWQLPCGQSWRL